MKTRTTYERKRTDPHACALGQRHTRITLTPGKRGVMVENPNGYWVGTFDRVTTLTPKQASKLVRDLVRAGFREGGK
jgi:hypothetical protein